MTKFKIIAFLLTTAFFTYNFAYAQFEAGHEWKEFGYFGGHAGTYSLRDDENGFFGGVIGFYHNQLVHNHPVFGADTFQIGVSLAREIISETQNRSITDSTIFQRLLVG